MSRGTETLVFRGGVPKSQHAAMRAPFQEGDFPGPVKYGYLSVGVVEQGPAALIGRTVFCLYPHQSRYVVPVSAVTPVPERVPAERAVLAGTVETAVNALWDATPLVGDRIAVVGGGMVGCAVAALLARFPGIRLQLVDADPARARTAEALGVDFAAPADALGDCDLVVHASATEAGLDRALRLPRPGRHRRGTELVRRPERGPAARRGLPLPPAHPAQQPGRHRLPRPPGPAAPTPTGWRSPWTCSPTRHWTRSSPGRALSENSRTSCRGWRPGRSPRCATGSGTPGAA